MVHLHSVPGAANPSRTSLLPVKTATTSSTGFQQSLSDAGFQAFQNLFGSGAGSSKTATAPVTTTANPSTSAAPAANAVTSSNPATAAISMLQNAMVAEGLDPSVVNMSYQSMNVPYVGGSYTLNQVKCQFQNGRVLYIDADAMKVNPDIAALDVKWTEQHPWLGQNA